jgi:hypothetical protein
VRLRPPGSAHRRHQGSGNSQSSAPDAFQGLRSLVLQGTRASFGLGPGSRPTQPFAVVMDFGLADGNTTVVAIADGSASVYLGSGGGFIGGGQSHESIRTAALKTVELADKVQPLLQATTAYPLAERGQVNLYVVTDAGVFTATASGDDVRGGGSPFSKLGDSAQNIIMEYRRIQESK